MLFSLTPTAIDYREPNISATMQQPSSVVHANYKTYKLYIHKEDTEKTQVFSSNLHQVSKPIRRILAPLNIKTCSQAGFQKCQLFDLCCCWTRHQQWPHHCLGWGLSNRLQPTPASMMCAGGMARQESAPPSESGA